VTGVQQLGDGLQLLYDWRTTVDWWFATGVQDLKNKI
jgi:hypothetical protein